MAPGDWAAVSGIYRAGIETGQATFETEPPSWETFDTGKLAAPRLVARLGRCVVGWVAVAPVSARPVYAGVVEHSLFVDPVHQGGGVGGRLLAALLTDADQLGIWTIQANVFPENVASLHLHAKFGFRQVGTRRRLGRMAVGPLAGQWRDVVLIEHRRDD
jgi:L-amino acid N-acyltransferase YncA